MAVYALHRRMSPGICVGSLTPWDEQNKVCCAMATESLSPTSDGSNDLSPLVTPSHELQFAMFSQPFETIAQPVFVGKPPDFATHLLYKALSRQVPLPRLTKMKKTVHKPRKITAPKRGVEADYNDPAVYLFLGKLIQPPLFYKTMDKLHHTRQEAILQQQQKLYFARKKEERRQQRRQNQQAIRQHQQYQQAVQLNKVEHHLAKQQQLPKQVKQKQQAQKQVKQQQQAQKQVKQQQPMAFKCKSCKTKT